MTTRLADFRAGLVAVFPTVAAAVPFALILGQQATAKGLTPAEMLAMSSIVFAGSSQLIAVGLWSTPAPVAALALMAFLVNLRHALMGASLSGKIAHFGRLRWVAAFLLTDEAWALSERRALDRPISRTFYFTVALTLFVCWQIASVLGTVFGAYLEHPETYGLDFTFPAIFIALALGFWKSVRRTGPVLVASAVVAVAVHAVVPGAWYVIAGAIAGITAAVVTAPREAPAADQAAGDATP
ncbi:branched-chain amino acid ABC transporter permease [Pleomorphomonas diazotrophica]|uniref:Branched-chain amino acid ABC transporter permease n=1 Tax=Pleomorphomonas diazotrophica TaxID=1166257 RepID=A0A1I4VEA4_9HYPH|nr:AzlC family ABC transporter permease [Pleomorphomonas diazotrophica]PKR90039.1 branched-chain amino acid ABC transporter permease [Pleomorphomonas diazotrophica]SFM99495.1 4-azaleucine resistance probable transporter AzlC [Pleomorphomonas diazotrophica]